MGWFRTRESYIFTPVEMKLFFLTCFSSLFTDPFVLPSCFLFSSSPFPFPLCFFPPSRSSHAVSTFFLTCRILAVPPSDLIRSLASWPCREVLVSCFS